MPIKPTIAIVILSLCTAAGAQTLQVESSAMAWRASFSEVGSNASEWANGSVKMPYVQSANTALAARINDALFLQHMGMPAPLKAGKTFALADGAEVPASTPSQDFTVTRNDALVFSVQFDKEGCGAYCENYAETMSFDARTGRVITLADVLNAVGKAEIPKLLVAEGARLYKAQIKQLEKELKAMRAKGAKAKSGDIDDLESRIDFNQTCLEQAQQKQADKSWYTVDNFRFDLPAGKGMLFTAWRCSNHAMRALDDVDNVSLGLSAQALGKMLTPYGQSLILDGSSVPEPTTVFQQLLHGKIGTAAITAWLTASSYSPGDISIRGLYYYNKYRKPIALSGKQVGQALTLSEGEGKSRATISLKLGPTGLSGQWDGDGKKLPMSLALDAQH